MTSEGLLPSFLRSVQCWGGIREMVLLDLSLSVRHRSAQGSAASQILDSFFWIFQSLLWRGIEIERRDDTMTMTADADRRVRHLVESREWREREGEKSISLADHRNKRVHYRHFFLSFFLRSFPPVLPQSIDPLLYKVIARPGAIFTIVGQDRMSAHSALFPCSLHPLPPLRPFS